MQLEHRHQTPNLVIRMRKTNKKMESNEYKRTLSIATLIFIQTFIFKPQLMSWSSFPRVLIIVMCMQTGEQALPVCWAACQGQHRSLQCTVGSAWPSLSSVVPSVWPASYSQLPACGLLLSPGSDKERE